MKFLSFFTILHSLFVLTTDCLAQNYRNYGQAPAFFMPQQERAPQQEKLPPIRPQDQAANQVYNTPNAQYDVKYVLVNGVFVPTFTKRKIPVQVAENTSSDKHPSIKKNTIKIELHDETNETSPTMEEPILQAEQIDINDNQTGEQEDTDVVTIEQAPTIAEENFSKEVTSVTNKNLINPPFEIVIDNNLPSYRNIYAQYINDTVFFQKEGIFPQNDLLEKSLNKMTSDKKNTVFKGSIKPNLKK